MNRWPDVVRYWPDVVRYYERLRGKDRADSTLYVMGSALAGAVLMYFLDPNHGRRRRALTRDQLVHAARKLRAAGQAASRDAAHRTAGAVAEARRWLRKETVPDPILKERVRAVLGRAVSHPHAVHVDCADGKLILSGPILENEVPLLLATVKKVPGVHDLEDRLEVHKEAGNISALQGGAPRSGNRFELMQNQWSPATRVLTGFMGLGLILAALRERDLLGIALGAAGGGLLARSVTNVDFGSMLGVSADSRGIVVQKSIHINAPLGEVFEFWNNYQNFPRFMSRVREVRPMGDNRSHWSVAGPAGVPVEWVSETTQVLPNQLIEWRSVEGSAVCHSGQVRFDDNGNRGTRVSIRLHYVPVAGTLGHAFARLFGADPKSDMDADLMRMKTLIETGHAPHDASQPGAGTGARGTKGNGQAQSARTEGH
jgi:uncharacterized membrane protein